jgi:hypothetical protein
VFEPGRSDAALQAIAREADAAGCNVRASCAAMLAGWVATSARTIHNAVDARALLRERFGRVGGLVRQEGFAAGNNPNDKGQLCSRALLAKQTLLLILNSIFLSAA